MNFKQGRYSGLITPLSYLIDLAIINFLLFNLFTLYLYSEFELKHFITISSLWILISVFNKFYYVYRYTNIVKLLNLLFNQIILFSLSFFCFLGLFSDLYIETGLVIKTLSLNSILIILIKLLSYYSIKKFRSDFGGNNRKTVIIGNSPEAQNLEFFFKTKKEAGYIHKKTFLSVNNDSINECLKFIKENNVDEIYCSLEQITDLELKALIKFSDNNLKEIKFIPNRTKLNSKKLIYETYDAIPILSLRKAPLSDSVNIFFKRLLDLIISTFVIVFILSWLTPIIALFIKKESNGPVFFKQIRNGINYDEFYCFKFRSMIVNNQADIKQATKGDPRVTRVGKFLRNTSLDEMPQFINVFIGDMSVVGPRPHMTNENDRYFKSVEKYMLRHSIKPGITGLAQVSGFRGEIQKESDIVNRIRLDIFYLENWSLLLDIKIIIRTITNSFIGEEKAY